MKIYFAAVAAIVLTLCLNCAAQTVGPTKMAFINTAAFSESTGIKRVIKALSVLEGEFRPRQTELETMKRRADTMEAEMRSGKLAVTAANSDQVEKLRQDIRRKAENAQADYDKRSAAVLKPIFDDVYPALEAYAKLKKIDVIVDSSKVGNSFFLMNEALDITNAFVAEYNSKNP